MSHETIYRSLYIQARGALKKELLAHLGAHGRSVALAITRRRRRTTAGSLTRCRSASGRPQRRTGRCRGTGRATCCPGAEQPHRDPRRAPDALRDAGEGAGKDTETVVNALIKQARKLPQELYRSLTWDRGSEMAAHRRFTLATDVAVYFCDPRNPWHRAQTRTPTACCASTSPRDRPVGSQPGRPRRGGGRARHPAAQDARIPDAGGDARGHRRVDPSKSPLLFGGSKYWRLQSVSGLAGPELPFCGRVPAGSKPSRGRSGLVDRRRSIVVYGDIDDDHGTLATHD